MNDMTVLRQLSGDQSLSDSNISRISELIYDTDPYIYPCLLGNREGACLVLNDLLMSGDDAMFNLDNICVAEASDTIVGILLWEQGPLIWNPEPMLRSFSKNHVSIPPYFDKVCNEYFGSYTDTPENVINLLNLCIAPAYRKRGIASGLLSFLIGAHPECIMRLHVLKDNPAAIKLYAKTGFEHTDTIDGFSSSDNKPLCHLMKRDPDNLAFSCLGQDCPTHCCSVYSGFDDRLAPSDGNLFSEIILTDDDVRKITDAGFSYLIRNSANNKHRVIDTDPDGICFALKDGRCSIYEVRPAICRAYPLYLDMFAGMTVQKECPGTKNCSQLVQDKKTVEALISVYEYWINHYRDSFELGKDH